MVFIWFPFDNSPSRSNQQVLDDEIEECTAAVEKILDCVSKTMADTIPCDTERCNAHSMGRYNARCEKKRNHKGEHYAAITGKF